MAGTYRAYYTDGTAARKIDRREGAGYAREVQRRAHTKKKRRANRLYMLFLTLSLTAAGLVLFAYIMLQSSISESASRIRDMEKQLTLLTKENDENYNRINGNIDLEEVRRIAIQEYGMRYVEEGQIVTYSDGGGMDYVRQTSEIPGAGR
ncbi:MAG: cell division protein FtsL [Lachnospiraceae bacterium]|nr:cell division protein FtsL [Lachnospiraceae bacterium]